MITDHPDYEVSNKGRVRSFKGYDPDDRFPFMPRILTPSPDQAGYLRVVLDGKHRYVHRLVAREWLGECPPGREVAHRPPFDRADNRPENLCYLTRQENLAQRQWKRSEKCRRGHKYTPANTYTVPSTGQRICKECRRILRRRDVCPTCKRPI